MIGIDRDAPRASEGLDAEAVSYTHLDTQPGLPKFPAVVTC